MIWTFSFGKYYSSETLNRFYVVFFILVGTRAVLIMKVSSGVNIFMRWVFQLFLILDFSSYGISALIVKS